MRPCSLRRISPLVKQYPLSTVERGSKLDFLKKPKKATTQAAQNIISAGLLISSRRLIPSRMVGVMGSLLTGGWALSRLMPLSTTSRNQLLLSGLSKLNSRCKMRKMFKYFGIEE